jgi:hypothetical protein
VVRQINPICTSVVMVAEHPSRAQIGSSRT